MSHSFLYEYTFEQEDTMSSTKPEIIVHVSYPFNTANITANINCRVLPMKSRNFNKFLFYLAGNFTQAFSPTICKFSPQFQK